MLFHIFIKTGNHIFLRDAWITYLISVQDVQWHQGYRQHRAMSNKHQMTSPSNGAVVQKFINPDGDMSRSMINRQVPCYFGQQKVPPGRSYHILSHYHIPRAPGEHKVACPLYILWNIFETWWATNVKPGIASNKYLGNFRGNFGGCSS